MIRLLGLAAVLYLAACAGSASSTVPPSGSAVPSVVVHDPPTPKAAPTRAERPYELSCGPMEHGECQATAAHIAADAAKRYPGKAIASIVALLAWHGRGGGVTGKQFS